MASEIQSRLAGNVVGFAHAIADRSQLAIAALGGWRSARRMPRSR